MFRRLPVICFFIALLGLMSVGQAKADDLFTYTLGSNTYTWELPGTLSLTSANYTLGDSFSISGVQYWENGVLQGTGLFDFYNANPQNPSDCCGGFDIMNGGTVLNEFGVQLYSGSESNPTFLLGTLTLNDGSLTGPEGTLTVTSINPTAVPEPSSLLLIGSGLISFLGFARKKLFAH